MDKGTQGLIDEVIEMNGLDHRTNEVYQTTILYQCCCCHQYRQEDGNYTKVNKALDMVFKTNPEDYEVSHTYCPSCVPSIKK